MAVQVVDVDRVGGDVEAEFVGLAVHVTGLHSAAGQPQAEAAVVVVAAVVAALHHRRPAEFAAPDDDRVLQQAALLEIGHERGAGLIGVEGVLLDAAVRLPC